MRPRVVPFVVRLDWSCVLVTAVVTPPPDAASLWDVEICELLQVPSGLAVSLARILDEEPAWSWEALDAEITAEGVRAYWRDVAGMPWVADERGGPAVVVHRGALQALGEEAVA